MPSLHLGFGVPWHLMLSRTFFHRLPPPPPKRVGLSRPAAPPVVARRGFSADRALPPATPASGTPEGGPKSMNRYVVMAANLANDRRHFKNLVSPIVWQEQTRVGTECGTALPPPTGSIAHLASSVSQPEVVVDPEGCRKKRACEGFHRNANLLIFCAS